MCRDSTLVATDGLPPALPRANRKLTELAQEVARRAVPLLPPGAHLILGLEQHLSGRLRMLWWRSDDFRLVAEIDATPEGFCPESSVEGAMQDAAVALLSYLSGRWPSTPRRLGVITDGSGVAFSPEHPAAAEPGWLVRHVNGGSRLTTILPLDPEGPCILLASPERTHSFH